MKMNMNTQLKNKNKRKLIMIIAITMASLFILLGGSILIYKFVHMRNKITINEQYLSKIDDNMYNLTEKITSLNGKIVTREKISNISISVKSGNLNILQKDLDTSKTWNLSEISLVPGKNIVCVTALLEESKLEECFTINNYNKENIGNIDDGDSDRDGLKNYEEIIFGTDSVKSDTDEDRVNDYKEVYITLTNPLKKDSDEDGIEDAYEDFDNDNIANIEEININTSPYLMDTDKDGLSDYDEVNEYNTNPTSKDSDKDGLSDYDEVNETKTDPSVKNKKIDVIKASSDSIASVEIKNLNSEVYETLSITKADIPILNSDIDGYILNAYNFNVEQKEIEATISFDLSSVEISEDANPVIYYYNEQTQMLEELETTIEGGRAYTSVKHFSTYVLIDKTRHDAIWSADTSSLIGDNYNNLDVVFVIDISLSMDKNDPTDSRKQMMSNFISALKENDRAGVVLFRRDSEVLNDGFSKNDGDKKKLITDVFNISNDNGYNWNSGTNGSQGLYTAINMFGDREDAKRYIIFLTDGEDTHYTYDYEYIYELAKAKRITILTIGLGSSVDEELLEEIAENTNGNYYYSEDSSDLYENYIGILEDTDDYRTDSNNDGISDYFTKLICEGTIKTTTGINPFGDLTYEDIQKNADYDKDGLKNSEEFVITVLDNKIYLKYISNPTLKDSDSDGLNDNEDASPLQAFDSGFIVGKKLQDKVDISSLEKERDEFNSLFGTGEKTKKDGDKVIKYKKDGIDKYSPYGFINFSGEFINSVVTVGAFSGKLIGAGDAHNAWNRYYDSTAKTYTEKDLVVPSITFNEKINEDSIYGSTDVQEYLKENYSMVMEIAEESIKNGDTQIIQSKNFLKGSGGDYDNNLNVFGFLNSSSSHIISEVTNNSGEYLMKLRYFIVDIYDWKSTDECDISSPACVSEVHYFNDMLLGDAKAFLVKIEYDLEITWSLGEEPKITLLEGTPYAK